MIQRFKVANYKGLQNFSLTHIGRINLVTGANGVGKSSLGEALWLFHGRYNPSLLWNLHVQRRGGMQISSPLTLLGRGHPIELQGYEDGRKYSVRFEYDEIAQAQLRPDAWVPQGPVDSGENLEPSLPSSPPDIVRRLNLPILGTLRATYGRSDPNIEEYESEVVPGPAAPGLVRPIPMIRRPMGIIVNRDVPFPVGSDRVEQFSNVVAQGQKRDLLEVLRLIRPPIQDVEILSHQGIPSLWADSKDIGLLPLESMGGGAVRLFGLLVNFYNARGGFIMIDEIENGIHYSALPELWHQITKLSDLLDVQAFITTHSLECLNAAVEVANSLKMRSEVVVHQMYQTRDGKRQSETYTGDKLMAALDRSFEIR